ncbi:MAG: aminodeoxychorismate/anthranilate synthase component II [Anderseniella sp.]
MILLIDNYDSFTWNLYHFLGDLGADTDVIRNDAITADEAIAMKPEAIVLSPGPCTPNEAGICLELVEKAAGNVPLMGVCLGHQAIGQAFGGKVVRAQQLMHGKLSDVATTGKGLFEGLPETFRATRYHSLVVERGSLPDCLEVTASTGDIVMGLQHKELNVHGVQFHPESIASEHGHAILRNFLKLADAYKEPETA